MIRTLLTGVAIAAIAAPGAFAQGSPQEAKLTLKGSNPLECTLTIGGSQDFIVDNLVPTTVRSGGVIAAEAELAYGCNAPYTVSVMSQYGYFANTSAIASSGAAAEDFFSGSSFLGVKYAISLDGTQVLGTALTPSTRNGYVELINNSAWTTINNLLVANAGSFDPMTQQAKVGLQVDPSGSINGTGLAGNFQEVLQFKIEAVG